MADTTLTPASPPGTAPEDTPDATPDRETSEPVVALTVDDSLLHVAPAAEVLSHLLAEAGPNGSLDPSQWEFFGRDGTMLALEADPATGAPTLVENAAAGEPSDLDRRLLLDRIDAFLARAQVTLTRELQIGVSSVHRRVPRLTGDLPDVVAGLALLMSLPESVNQPHSRNWVHNLGHRLGI